jgi:chitodextrinase
MSFRKTSLNSDLRHLRPVRALAAVLVMACAAAPVWAAPRDRTPPTTPTNLRATAVTPSSVALAWNASSDNSGTFNYYVQCSNGVTAYVPQFYTSYNFVSNLTPGQSYSFFVYAVDGARNRSGNSNTLTVTLPLTTDPPSTPALSATSVGPRHISLSWTASIGDAVRYWVYDNGVQVMQWGQDTSYVAFVAPETTHSFMVRGRDRYGNWSAFSNTVTVTTPPTDPNDHTPPTTPAGVTEMHFGDAEVWVSWSESTDNVTPQDWIYYFVYMNGELSDVQVGTGERSINYGKFGEWNTIEVIAADEAGNRSAPATLTFFLG